MDNFQTLSEYQQSKYLLELAYNFCSVDIGFLEIRKKLNTYLGVCFELLDAVDEESDSFNYAYSLFHSKDTEPDFVIFYEQVDSEPILVSFLNVSTYACAFALRLYSERFQTSEVTDIVKEALPEIYEFYIEDILRLKNNKG